MAGGSNVFRFGPFDFDISRERLFLGASRVRLSGSQTGILLHLLSHAGDVVAKDALAHAGWRHATVSKNSLDKAISRIRGKLANGEGGTHYIETLAGRGYRFAVPIERAHRHDADDPLEKQLIPFLAFSKGQADLDTLDRDAIVRARRAFEEVLRADPGYAPAHLGLAIASALAFEATRVDIAPDAAALKVAIDHARTGCELAPASADAWSTLAFALCLNGDTGGAHAAACKAIALEPDNWRHALRLSYVSWGEERLRAARRVDALCPRFALAYWLQSTVFIARQAFDHALELLRDGCAAQDAQSTTTRGFPAVGLHLLRGLVLGAMGAVDEAIQELTRELESPHHGQLYARECVSNTWYTLGALHLRQRQRKDADAAFKKALTVVPGHTFAAAALGLDSPGVVRAQTPNTIDLAVAKAIRLARAGRHPDAASVCTEALKGAPPGLAGWLLAADPFLNPTARPEIWAETLTILRDRAI